MGKLAQKLGGQSQCQVQNKRRGGIIKPDGDADDKFIPKKPAKGKAKKAKCG